MSNEIALERVALQIAEHRVPGSTQAGGHYHLSEAWRAMIRRNARAVVDQPPDTRPVAAPAGSAAAAH